jgi:hypothetical protein
LPHFAGQCFALVDPHAFRHIPKENSIYGFIHPYCILLLVLVTGAQDLIVHIPIIGQEDQSLGIFVQSANGKYALGIVDETDDISPDIGIRSSGDPHGLIKGHNDPFLLYGRLYDAAVYHYLVALPVAVAGHCYLIVQQHATGLDQAVGLTPGTISRVTDEFI